jgi:hypothetical protein
MPQKILKDSSVRTTIKIGGHILRDVEILKSTSSEGEVPGKTRKFFVRYWTLEGRFTKNPVFPLHSPSYNFACNISNLPKQCSIIEINEIE